MHGRTFEAPVVWSYLLFPPHIIDCIIFLVWGVTQHSPLVLVSSQAYKKLVVRSLFVNRQGSAHYREACWMTLDVRWPYSATEMVHWPTSASMHFHQSFAAAVNESTYHPIDRTTSTVSCSIERDEWWVAVAMRCVRVAMGTHDRRLKVS